MNHDVRVTWIDGLTGLLPKVHGRLIFFVRFSIPLSLECQLLLSLETIAQNLELNIVHGQVAIFSHPREEGDLVLQ